jgi:LuxR family maltose regulon positive regulatory protein
VCLVLGRRSGQRSRPVLSDVLAALTSAAQGLGEVPARLLSAPGTTALGDVVPGLLNELAAQTEPIILVVDDYQAITHRDIQEGVALLVERMPPALCLVIAGRSQPTALPIVRWRGRGRLVELTATDLALTPAETAELLARELPAPPSAEDAARLHERTEGWVAGLHLAALSLRRRPDPHDGIADITSDNRDIGDYLAAEVLAQLPPEVRRFLRRPLSWSGSARRCATPPSHAPTRRPCRPASSTSSSSSSRWTNIASGSPAANPRSWP